MFAKTIIDSDAFLDMSLSTQALYFHLSMRADDDGFINNPKKIMRMIGANEDDLKVLMAKKFILVFESGVIVIKHWKIHNYIQKDRYKPTVYTEEASKLNVKSNNAYSMDTECIHDGYRLETQVRLGKDSIGKDSIGKKESKKPFDDLISSYTENEALKESLQAFIEMRKKIKAAITERAFKMILNKLDKLAESDSDKIEILNNSTMNSWKGIFELKGVSHGQSGAKKDHGEFEEKSYGIEI